MKVMNGLDLQSRPITNLADPSSAQQAATKNYVDSVIRGLDWKQEVVAASTGNVTLATPGTSLDGVTLTVNDRVLLKDQTTASQNGVYVWTASGSALTRATDSNTGPLLSGSTYTVQKGTVNADRVYRVTTDDTITVDTTSIAFTQVGGAGQTYSGSTSILVSAGVISAILKSNGGILVDGSGLYVDTSLFPRKYASAIGNGSSTSIAVTHNLNTRDVVVNVYDAATYEDVICDPVRTDANNVTVTFATAPASGAYRVVVVG